MISALYRFPKPMRRKMASMWGTRGAGVRAKNRMGRGIDADTARFRALHSRRGLPVRELWTFTGVIRAVYSMHGRSNQIDVWIGRRFWQTCGPRRLPAWLR